MIYINKRTWFKKNMNCTQVFFFLPKLTRPFHCTRARFFSSHLQAMRVPLYREFFFLPLTLTKPIVPRVFLVCGPDGASIHDRIEWDLCMPSSWFFLCLIISAFFDLFPLFFILVLFLSFFSLCFLLFVLVSITLKAN